MEIVHEPKLLESYLDRYEIRKMFQTENLHFRLFRYHRGEQIVSPNRKLEHMLFMVEGNACIYGIREDAGYSPVAVHTPLTIYGDLEFATGKTGTLYVEAQTEVCCIGLSLAEYGHLLHQDCRFLNQMLSSLGQKFFFISHIETSAADLEDQVLFYMRNYCADQCIHSVNDTMIQLRCSRRQLQRVLSKLCETGKIEKIKKGTYRLI